MQPLASCKSTGLSREWRAENVWSPQLPEAKGSFWGCLKVTGLPREGLAAQHHSFCPLLPPLDTLPSRQLSSQALPAPPPPHLGIPQGVLTPRETFLNHQGLAPSFLLP